MTVELQSMLSAAGIAEPGAAGTELTADMRAIFQEYATDKMLSALSDVVGGAGSIRATLGAEQNGLSSTIRSNQAAIVNVSDARNQIIQQASNSILAQANQLPQAALSLLG
jgi:flagellin